MRFSTIFEHLKVFSCVCVRSLSHGSDEEDMDGIVDDEFEVDGAEYVS